MHKAQAAGTLFAGASSIAYYAYTKIFPTTISVNESTQNSIDIPNYEENYFIKNVVPLVAGGFIIGVAVTAGIIYYVRRSDKYQPISSYTEVNNEKDEDFLCIYCVSSKATHVFLPCGHLNSCGNCANMIYKTKKQCPYDRQPLTSPPLQVILTKL